MDWDIPDRTKRHKPSTDIRLFRQPFGGTKVQKTEEPSAKADQSESNSAGHKRPDHKNDPIVITRQELRRYLRLGGIGLIALLVLFLAWQYFNARRDVATLSNPKNSAEKANAELVQELQRISILPNDENPQVAELTDKEKQKNNPFFKDAQNGDKVLVYQKAGKIIIYRPATKQVVNMASLNGQSSSTGQGTSADINTQ